MLHEHPEPSHDPSRALAELVRLRDPLCTGPGCSTSSHRSDLDHETPWPTGPAAPGNLRPRSRRCHRAKTFSWTVTRHPDDSTRWTSPTGRSYHVPPYWPPTPTPHHSRQTGPDQAGPDQAGPDDEPDSTLTGTLTGDLDDPVELTSAELAELRGLHPVPAATPARTPRATLTDDDPPPF